MMYATGRKQDDLTFRRRAAAQQNFSDWHRGGTRLVQAASIMQPVSYLMDQAQKPSCVGKSYQGRLNALLGVDPSGVGLWTLARAIEGNLSDPMQGTTPQAAINVLLNHGWGPSHPADDMRPVSEDLQLPTIDDELSAFDNQLPKAVAHYVCTGTDAQIENAVIDALARTASAGKFRNVVSFGTGVLPPFEEPPPDTVLDETYLSADAPDGHEQGIVGYLADRDAFVVQGSWGKWTWCNAIINNKKKRLDGCCLVSRSVVTRAWAVDVLQVQ
jgi:hypothetical protein